MRTLRYNFASTLDGFIASPSHATTWIVSDPSIDFEALFTEFSTFIMGRKSYEVLLQHDINPLAGRPKDAIIVFSTTMKPNLFPDVTVVSEDVVDFVRGLKDEKEGKDIWVMGGARLVGGLMREGLVDVVEAAVMPVAIGQGVKMVEGLGGDVAEEGLKLELEGVKRLEGSGILMTRYKVLGRSDDNL